MMGDNNMHAFPYSDERAAEVELMDNVNVAPLNLLKQPSQTDHTHKEINEFSVFNMRSNKKIYENLVQCHQRDVKYILALEALLKENGISLPAVDNTLTGTPKKRKYSITGVPLLPNAEYETLKESFAVVAKLAHVDEYEVQYRNVSFWGMVPKTYIPTVGSTLRQMFMGSGPKHRTDILKDLTGRIRAGKMTLVTGPPGCGKSSLLKALSGQLTRGGKTLDGDLLYNGVKASEGKFILPKITDYADERDQHAPTLTVRETIEFAWRVTSNSKHSYGFAKDAEAAEILDTDNESLKKVRDIPVFYNHWHVVTSMFVRSKIFCKSWESQAVLTLMWVMEC